MLNVSMLSLILYDVQCLMLACIMWFSSIRIFWHNAIFHAHINFSIVVNATIILPLSLLMDHGTLISTFVFTPLSLMLLFWYWQNKISYNFPDTCTKCNGTLFHFHFNCIGFGCKTHDILSINVGHDIDANVECDNTLVISLSDSSLASFEWLGMSVAYLRSSDGSLTCIQSWQRAPEF